MKSKKILNAGLLFLLLSLGWVGCNNNHSDSHLIDAAPHVVAEGSQLYLKTDDFCNMTNHCLGIVADKELQVLPNSQHEISALQKLTADDPGEGIADEEFDTIPQKEASASSKNKHFVFAVQVPTGIFANCPEKQLTAQGCKVSVQVMNMKGNVNGNLSIIVTKAQICQADAECPTGNSCISGSCSLTPVKLCTADADCSGNQACISGVCTDPAPQACTADADCTASMSENCFGAQCVNNTCKFQCGGNEPAGDGVVELDAFNMLPKFPLQMVALAPDNYKQLKTTIKEPYALQYDQPNGLKGDEMTNGKLFLMVFNEDDTEYETPIAIIPATVITKLKEHASADGNYTHIPANVIGGTATVNFEFHGVPREGKHNGIIFLDTQYSMETLKKGCNPATAKKTDDCLSEFDVLPLGDVSKASSSIQMAAAAFLPKDQLPPELSDPAVYEKAMASTNPDPTIIPIEFAGDSKSLTIQSLVFGHIILDKTGGGGGETACKKNEDCAQNETCSEGNCIIGNTPPAKSTWEKNFDKRMQGLQSFFTASCEQAPDYKKFMTGEGYYKPETIKTAANDYCADDSKATGAELTKCVKQFTDEYNKLINVPCKHCDAKNRANCLTEEICRNDTCQAMTKCDVSKNESEGINPTCPSQYPYCITFCLNKTEVDAFGKAIVGNIGK